MQSNGLWQSTFCFVSSSFLCQPESVTITETGLTHVELKKDQLTLLPFYVLFKSQVDSKKMPNTTEGDDNRMSGFKLNWFLKDSNGSLLTENLPSREEDWKTEVPTPKYKQPLLAEMVQTARDLRIQSKTRAKIQEQIFKEKLQKISVLEEEGTCNIKQITSEQLSETFQKLLSSVDKKETEGPVTEEDIKTGFQLFQTIIYCPSPMVIKHFRFVDNLLSVESSRTIIQTLVNTFRSGIITDKTSFALAKEFYSILASTLDLQYGDVLLATSTRSQLEEMLDNDWPFFTNNTQLMENCLKDSDCDGTQDIIKVLGKS